MSISSEIQINPRKRPGNSLARRATWIFIGLMVLLAVAIQIGLQREKNRPLTWAQRQAAEKSAPLAERTAAARAEGDSWLKAQHFLKLADEHRRAGDQSEWHELLREAAAVAAKDDGANPRDSRPEQRCRMQTAAALELTYGGWADEARPILADTFRLVSTLRWAHDRAEIWTDLAVALRRSGDEPAGIAALAEAEADIFRPNLDWVTYMPRLAALCLARTEFGDEELAEVYLKELSERAPLHHDPERQAWGVGDTSAVFYRAGRSDLGRPFFDIAFAAAKKVPNPRDRSSQLMSLVWDHEAYRDLLPLEEVKKLARQAAEQIDDNPGMRDHRLMSIDAMLPPRP